MKNVTKFDQGLSIKELEERHELTVAFGGDAADADKYRCNGNSGTISADPSLMEGGENPE